jgi:hypothetical protein
MRELLLPVAEGVDTRRWLIERRIRMLEDQLRDWAAEPNPPLARAAITQRLEDAVCKLYEELEAVEGVPRPNEVARAIQELTEDDFLRYLEGFRDDQIVGWAGKLAWCPLALYIREGTMIRTEGLSVKVHMSHILVSDGLDEWRLELPWWMRRVVEMSTPPTSASEGTPISALELRDLLANP